MYPELLAFLEQYHPLPPGLTARLGELLRTASFRKKEFLLREGQTCNHIYFIEKGLIRVYYLKDGLEICSGLLCEGGAVISVHSFFNRTPSYEFVQALEDTVVHYISFEELQSLYKDYVEFNVVGRKLIQEYYVRSEDRTYMLRRLSAQEKFDFFQKNLGPLLGRVPRKDIASYLGINSETLSRLGY